MLRSWFGEKKAAFKIWLSLDSRVYRRFHDVLIPSRNGAIQVDHLVVSPFGLFIIETNNKSGWIFGFEDQPIWTQMLSGQKYSFQNPLRQTFRQKKGLAEFLNLDETLIHPVVYFIGDSKFKTRLPANVIDSKPGRYVKQFATRVIPPEEINRIVAALEQHISESPVTTWDHARSLRKRQSSETVCPNCGSDLVKRTATQGLAGKPKFLSCASYPKCRFTRSV